MKIFFCLYIFIFSLFPSHAYAERQVAELPPTHGLSWEHLTAIADSFDIPVAILCGILATEGGQPGKAWSNKNGSWDMGPFQINTCHVHSLVGLGIDPAAVMRDARLNAVFAAHLLRSELDRTGDIWAAVGAYHSRNPALARAYIARVRSNMSELDVRSLIQRVNRVK